MILLSINDNKLSLIDNSYERCDARIYENTLNISILKN